MNVNNDKIGIIPGKVNLLGELFLNIWKLGTVQTEDADSKMNSFLYIWRLEIAQMLRKILREATTSNFTLPKSNPLLWSSMSFPLLKVQGIQQAPESSEATPQCWSCGEKDKVKYLHAFECINFKFYYTIPANAWFFCLLIKNKNIYYPYAFWTLRIRGRNVEASLYGGVAMM